MLDAAGPNGPHGPHTVRITEESPWLEAAWDFLPTLTGPRPDPSVPSMNPNLAAVWQQPSRYKVLYGGRGSSKTWDAAANAIRIAQSSRVRILCARQFQSKIEDSVYTTIVRQIDRFGLRSRFDIQNNKIICRNTKSEFLFYGIARNIAEMKGMEGIDILWLEEAEAVSGPDFLLLIATIRAEGSEVWVVFNPNLDMDFVYQHLIVHTPPNCVLRKVNWNENPFLTKTHLEEIITLMVEDPEEYEFQYLGVPRSDSDLVMVKRSWLESCRDANQRFGLTPTGPKRLGFDVADDGPDRNSTVLAQGGTVLKCETWKGLEDRLLESCSRVWACARDNMASVDYDCIGVGASAGNRFRELNEEAGHDAVQYRKFNAGAGVIHPKREYKRRVRNIDHFENRKAQAWMEVADRARETHAMVRGEMPVDPERVLSFDTASIGRRSAAPSSLSSPRRSGISASRER